MSEVSEKDISNGSHSVQSTSSPRTVHLKNQIHVFYVFAFCNVCGDNFFPDCVVVHSAPGGSESFENSDNVVHIKIQGSDSHSVKQFQAIKVSIERIFAIDIKIV